MSEYGSIEDDNTEYDIPGQAADGDGDQLSSEDTLEDRGVDDLLDEGYSPPERPSVLGDGLTADEERRGDTLDERLAEEEPDFDALAEAQDEADYENVGGEVGDARAGRLSDDSGLGDEEENDVLATDVGIDGGAAGAEEAAMHIIEPS